ncbi:hypothetical protein F4778DRAFT_414695 [Xylariomycetidae sp. FL2044]|nr:hypothetical protein F4778DRAFT_414695 [Xylariomycetidae sp. FL2044]
MARWCQPMCIRVEPMTELRAAAWLSRGTYMTQRPPRPTVVATRHHSIFLSCLLEPRGTAWLLDGFLPPKRGCQLGCPNRQGSESSTGSVAASLVALVFLILFVSLSLSPIFFFLCYDGSYSFSRTVGRTDLKLICCLLLHLLPKDLDDIGSFVRSAAPWYYVQHTCINTYLSTLG